MAEGKDMLVGRYVADRYRVLRKIGEGGMGDVYAAEDLDGSALVALKVMRRDAEDPATPERFLREAQTLGRIRSRNVVKIYNFERDMHHGILFVAMELIVGDDLSRLLHHGRIPPPLALRVIEQTANGLGAAHGAGLIHRDLKPSNLKLKPKSDHSVRLKILDFGLVRDKYADSVLTDLGKAPGTLTYMPPEVLQERELDSRADLYSLGVIAYEMLCGIPPFTAKSRIEVAAKHLREEPEPYQSRVPERLPTELIELVEGLMVKDPDGRIGSTDEVLDIVTPMLRDSTHDFSVSHIGESRDPFFDWHLLPHLRSCLTDYVPT